MADAIKSNTPPPAMPRKTNPLIITAVVALVAVAAGYAIGASRQSTPPPAGVDKSQNTYEAGYEAAKQKLVELGFARPNDMPITNLSGKVTAVSADSVTIETELPLANPLDEKRVVSVVVKIGSETKVSRQRDFNDAAVQKDQLRYNEEMLAFQKAMADGQEATPPTPPSMTVKIDLADIKVGAMVMVMTPDDMAKVSEVLGGEIQLMPAPPAPPTMPPPPEAAPAVEPTPPAEEPAP